MIRSLLLLLGMAPFAVFAQSLSGQARSLPPPVEYEVIKDHDGKTRTVVAFRLCLDPDGRIACLEPLPDQNRKMVNAVMESVPRWRFTPARLDGVPAHAESRLLVYLEGESDGKGGVSMRITRAHTAPGVIKSPPPRYPQREYTRQRPGNVLLNVEVQADGSVAKVEADKTFSDAAFVSASVQAVRRWTFEPERIAGQPVSTRLIIPVHFVIPGKPREKPRWDVAFPGLDEHPLALNSAIGQITGAEE